MFSPTPERPHPNQAIIEALKKSIDEGHLSKIEQSDIITLLQRCCPAGLSGALELFELSSLSPMDNLNRVDLLSQTLANPLCQVIFNARLRLFSDYSEGSECLGVTQANQLIEITCSSTVADTRVKNFFDYMAQYRPCPPTQKYMVDIDFQDEVCSALRREYEALAESRGPDEALHAIEASLDACQNHQMDSSLFDTIKYSVASQVESTDYYSMRGYDDLMRSIWEALQSFQIESLLMEIDLGVSRRLS